MGISELGRMDSNHRYRLQRPVPYRLATPHRHSDYKSRPMPGQWPDIENRIDIVPYRLRYIGGLP